MDVARRIGRGASSCANGRAGRICGAIASRFANRCLAYSVGAISILGSKCIHIYAHISALPKPELMRWGLSFFVQDTALILVLRLLFDAQMPLFAAYRYVRYLATTVGSLLVLFHLLLATINIGFYIMTGSELHWRNIGFAGGGGSGSWGVLLSGLFSCGLALAVLLLISWVVQDVCYGATGIALDLICKPFTFVFRKVPCFSRSTFSTVKYENIPQKDVDLEGIRDKDEDDDEDHQRRESSGPEATQRTGPTLSNKLVWLAYAVVAFLLVAQVALSIMRPNESSLAFMTWTAALLPFIDFAHSSPILSDLLPHYGNSIGWGWDNQTSLGEPIPLSWLPKLDKPLPGFADWYADGSDHYNAKLDPLKIDNLDDDLLESLRGKLDGVDIRHVVLLKLESTRQDAFPLRRDGLILKTLEETWEGGKFPAELEKKLGHLTPTANFLTGDYDDGFEHNDTSARGGLVYTGDHTTATYTLKSLPGTMCGINPLVVDFNFEYDNHIYQPCLAHIFDAFNELDKSKDSGADAYTKYKWNNTFMSSVTGYYDKQDLLMKPMGYSDKQMVNKEFLQSDNATFGKVTLPEINYYGMAEEAIDDYIVDAFKTANEKKERVFLSHITSTTHHPFKIPDGEPWADLAPEGKLGDLVGYTNAISYVDSWLRRILDILEEQNASNNTLVILVGDHGLSVPETGGVTPYYQPNIGSFHVPLVFSHPQLPQITINGSVNSISVLPTILDLLIETGSLDPSDRAAAKDLVRNYEGQSLIRPYKQTSPKTGQADWQFTVMNPGRAQISTRSPLHPDWRIVAPVVKDIEWRFTNVEEDPQEKDGVLAFDFVSFLTAVEKKYGRDAAEWAEEAAFMTRWWVEENHKRWRYKA